MEAWVIAAGDSTQQLLWWRIPGQHRRSADSAASFTQSLLCQTRTDPPPGSPSQHIAWHSLEERRIMIALLLLGLFYYEVSGSTGKMICFRSGGFNYH